MFVFVEGAPGQYRRAPSTSDYLNRTTTLVSTDVFCTGIWIGTGVCPLSSFVFIFSQRRVALHYAHADCEHHIRYPLAVFWSVSQVRLPVLILFAR